MGRGKEGGLADRRKGKGGEGNRVGIGERGTGNIGRDGGEGLWMEGKGRDQGTGGGEIKGKRGIETGKKGVWEQRKLQRNCEQKEREMGEMKRGRGREN